MAVKKAAPKAAAKPAAKSAAAINTVTLRHLSVALAESHELPKKQVNGMMDELIAMLTKHLKKGDR
ncbi:MAG: HU family DNA-binding protein, partial [Hyphomicrobium sp.]